MCYVSCVSVFCSQLFHASTGGVYQAPVAYMMALIEILAAPTQGTKMPITTYHLGTQTQKHKSYLQLTWARSLLKSCATRKVHRYSRSLHAQDVGEGSTSVSKLDITAHSMIRKVIVYYPTVVESVESHFASDARKNFWGRTSFLPIPWHWEHCICFQKQNFK